MSLLSNLQDKLAYTVHSLTYDPEAERYAESKRAALEAEDAARKAKQQKEAKEQAAAEQKTAEEARRAKEAEDRKARSEFRTGRFLATVFGTIGTILLAFFAIAGGVYGAHLATNLNIYRSWPYRLLYAIYGFLFFPVVIVYVLGYRWWWKGRKPRYYALLPLIPYFINQPLLSMLLSWMTYKPDDVMDALHEWNPAMVEWGIQAQEAALAEEAKLV